MLLYAKLTQHLFPQASELGHSLNENVLKPAQEKVWVAPKIKVLVCPTEALYLSGKWVCWVSKVSTLISCGPDGLGLLFLGLPSQFPRTSQGCPPFLFGFRDQATDSGTDYLQKGIRPGRSPSSPPFLAAGAWAAVGFSRVHRVF